MKRFIFTALLLIIVVPASGQDAAYVAIGCDSCDGQMPCDGYSSSCGQALPWSVTVDALFLNRSDPESGVLAFNTVNPTQSLNANDFDFDTETGFDLSLTKALRSGNAIELRYFGVDDWDARLSEATTANDLLQFNAAVPVFAAAGDAITASYTSELQNFECNLSRQFNDWLAVGAGFRYLELEERGTGGLVNAAVPFDYVAATRNRLYGAQVGVQALWWCDDLFQLDTIGKVGIYGNDAQHNALVDTGTARLTAGGSDDRTAFIGEIGVNAATHLTSRLSLRGGYRLLWIDDVALASDQLAASDFFTGSGFDGNGEVFYHGAFVGLELTN